MRLSLVAAAMFLVLVIAGCQRGTNPLAHKGAPSNSPEYTVQPDKAPTDK